MAYKAVIIDDNRNTVRSLEQGVPWGEVGIEIAGVAFDGKEGRRLIESVLPEIIITDINMPYIDGLTMVESVLELLPESKIIVITGYEKFQYASRAIKLSVFDYILKPIDDLELLTALKGAVKSIQKNRGVETRNTIQIKGKLISALLSEKDSMLTSIHIQGDIGTLRCAIIAAGTKEGFSQPFLQRLEQSEYYTDGKIVSVIFKEKLIIFIFDSEADISARIHELAGFLRKNDKEIQIGTSEIHSLEYNIKDMYLEAYERMLNDYDSIMQSIKAGTKVADIQVEAVKLAESAGGSADYETVFQSFMGCTGGSIKSLQVMSVIYGAKVLQKYKQWEIQLEPVVYNAIYNTSVETFKIWLKTFLKTLDSIRRENKGRSELVINVLSYMKLHVLENMSLEQVASKFFVSPNYLSSLIRKETGTTFQQHMLLNKIMISKQLLDDTRMRVEEIAYTIGYENYVSFYNAFKKVEGVSPREYRMRSRR